MTSPKNEEVIGDSRGVKKLSESQKAEQGLGLFSDIGE